MVIQYGLWDQIRIDKGSEWVLMLHVQDTLAEHRNCTIKLPYIATTSKKVHKYNLHILIKSIKLCRRFVQYNCKYKSFCSTWSLLIYTFCLESHNWTYLGWSQPEGKLPGQSYTCSDGRSREADWWPPTPVLLFMAHHSGDKRWTKSFYCSLEQSSYPRCAGLFYLQVVWQTTLCNSACASICIYIWLYNCYICI